MKICVKSNAYPSKMNRFEDDFTSEGEKCRSFLKTASQDLENTEEKKGAIE